MSTARTSFTPGDWAAVCGPDAWLLVQVPFDDARLGRLYETLSGTPTGGLTRVDAVLEVLLADGLGAVPAFACAAVEGAGARVVVRHPAVAAVTVNGAEAVHEPAAGTTWSDLIVPADTVVLQASAATATGVRLPLHGGVTPAAALVVAVEGVTATAAAPTAPAAAAAAAPAPEAAAAEEAAPEPEPVIEPEAEPEAEPEPVIEPEAEPEAEPEEDPAAESLDKRRKTFAALLTSDTTDRDALLAQMAEEEEAALDDTQPESAAQPDTAQPDSASSAGGGSSPNPMTAVWKVDEAPPAPEPSDKPTDKPESPAPAPSPAAPASGGGLIDGVPWLSGGAVPSAAPAAPPRPSFVSPERVDAPLPPAKPAADSGNVQIPGSSGAGSVPTPSAPTPAPSSPVQQEDNATISRADLLASLGSAGVVGPSVLAVTCPQGHATSPAEPTCRLCKASIGDQEPTQIPRPPLGALVLNGNDRLVLDKGAVLGRAPVDDQQGQERPHLLRVGDSGEISRSHAQITLDGWHVIVRDLGSANGTTLTLPGGSPQQLRANEDYQLEDGAEIGIADLVTLRYEVKP